jgi:AraC family transcriptional regulator
MIRLLGTGRPSANSKPIRTNDYSVELQRCGPAFLPAIYHSLHVVGICLSDGLVVSGNVPTAYARGEAFVRPAGMGSRVDWPGGAHWLYVHLHPRIVRAIAQRTWRIPDASLVRRSRIVDRIISEIGLELYDQLRTGHARNDHDARDLVLALAHHVVTGYAAAAAPPVRIGMLAAEDLLDAFRQNVANFEGVAALASRAGLTRTHFSRRVHQLTGLAPYTMVMGSRVEAAKFLLTRQNHSLSDVAYLAGFADQSHLTRVFGRLAGVTPAQFRFLAGSH